MITESNEYYSSEEYWEIAQCKPIYLHSVVMGYIPAHSAKYGPNQYSVITTAS